LIIVAMSGSRGPFSYWQIVILTVPVDSAQESADIAVGAGIRAIWNFTPYRVKVADGIVMANTSIYAHLALIFNRLNTL